MDNAIDVFRSNMLRAKTLGGLHDAISKSTTSIVDVTDILRAQIVLSVSALDYYIHQITLMGMLEVFDRKRPPTKGFLDFRVSMDSVLAKGTVGGNSWLEDEIREYHGYHSFQNPERITEAVRLFSNVKLWGRVSKKLSLSEQDAKSQLEAIIARRNKIAHEADMDPTYPNARWPITKLDAQHAVEFIENLCEAIHISISRPR